MTTLEDLLDDPAQIANIPNTELHKLLAPYYPAVRQPVLPEQKAKKLTHVEEFAMNALKENAALIEQMRKAKK